MYTPEQISAEYARWMAASLKDADLIAELESVKGNDAEISDRFYRDLEFGTGGLRGVIGAGTNRINVHTVAKATQGLSNYLKKDFDAPSVAIAYDSRIKSDLFAKTAAAVFASNGIKVYIYKELMPTPALSFAVRYLKATAGVVVTASHNPSKYNGYKVYGSDGCQMTLDAAAKVLAEIEKSDIFSDVKFGDFEEELEKGNIEYIGEDLITAYINAVSSQAIRMDEIDKNVSIVYTPLNGSGLKCVTRTLKENGFTNILVVPEQEKPDGNFPTCPYPNPEIREALETGLKFAKENQSDILIATDPDCDRMGIAVKDGDDFTLMTGNQVGILLLDYIAKSRIEKGTMPKDPVAIKTIVTTEMVAKIAQKYGVELINVLTGFKFIGEQILWLEEKGEDDRYIFGFEESYGYLTGSYVRDKDGVDASLMVCEMFAYYKGKGLSLVDVLNNLYEEHGCFINSLKSFTFEGAAGFATMNKIMSDLRENPVTSAVGKKLVALSDYKTSEKAFADGKKEVIELPKSNVLKFDFEDDITVVARPSGTEPKLKLYFSVKADSVDSANALTKKVTDELTELINRY